VIEASPEEENKAEGGYPEFPDENMILDRAMVQAKSEVQRMFFPWNESVKLTYYNDKDCGMKQAYELLKRGEKDAALQQSLTNLDGCKANSAVKPKVLGRAYYNVGMSYFTVNDFDHALEMLNQAAQLHPGNIVNEAIAGCNHAKSLAADMQRFEQRVQLEASKTAAPSESAGGGQAGPGPDQGAAPVGDTTKSQASPEERLKKLNSLFKRGLISKEDYEQKKAEILKEL
jgi:tetratricopeptide (TPR) repeat protein